MKNEVLKQSIISQIEEIGYMNYLDLKKDEINFIDYLPDINFKDKKGNTALMLVCTFGYINIIKKLIDANAKINSTNYSGYTPLMMACRYGYLDIVKILIENNAKIDDTNIHTYYTALMCASSQGHTDIVKYLIEKDVNLDSQAKDGTTALMYAVKNAHLDIVKLLLEAKADISLVDKEGMEALKWAWHYYKLDYDKYVSIVEVLQPYMIKSRIFGSKLFKFFKRDKTNKEIIKIKVYKNDYIKLEDILNNKNIDSKRFNNFFPQRLYPEIENIEYVHLVEFKRFCLANKLDFKIEE